MVLREADEDDELVLALPLLVSEMVLDELGEDDAETEALAEDDERGGKEGDSARGRLRAIVVHLAAPPQELLHDRSVKPQSVRTPVHRSRRSRQNRFCSS